MIRSLGVFLVAAAGCWAQSGPQILQTRCVQCHGETTALSDLHLNSREGALQGGTRGPAIKPGDAADSLLYRAVSQTGEPHMPPTGKLADEEIAALRDWIQAGAEWDAKATSAKPASDWWAFKKPVKPEVPNIPGVDNPIDAFIAAKLKQEGLEAGPKADPRTLIRRATFDLHGLPPTFEEEQQFASGPDAPAAWKALVDKLLASQRYGEKWGRHWLDLVRYGDTSGFEQDPYNLEAWRFRDYVIKSFNDDKPYDKFVKEQLAGDEIWPDDAEARTGTGYYRVNANRDMLFKVEDLNRTEKLADYVDTTSKVFLALTVGCARCHDHKFDPIPQKDFYRMQAIFAPAVSDRVYLEYNSARFYDLAHNTWDFTLRNISSELRAMFGPYTKRIRDRKLQAAEDPAAAIAAFDLERDYRTPEQLELTEKYAELAKVSDDEIRAELSPNDRDRLDVLERKLVGIMKGWQAPPMAPGVVDVGREAPRTYVAVRGNPEVPGEEVKAGYLSVLGGGDTPDPPEHATTTYRRKHLAEWIATKDNPLTARVMVNRIWQFHFGQPLVETPNDFGTRATRVSHPELLDWLAVEFMERGWSIKEMNRLIMTSEAYQRRSTPSDAATEKDPQNRYLSHFNRRRLQAEEIRDAALLATGELNLEMGGAPVVVPLDEEELYGITGKPSDRWVVTWDPQAIHAAQRLSDPAAGLPASDVPGLRRARRDDDLRAPQREHDGSAGADAAQQPLHDRAGPGLGCEGEDRQRSMADGVRPGSELRRGEDGAGLPRPAARVARRRV